METEITRLNTACIECIYGKFLKAVPEGTDEPQRLRFAKGILKIIAESSDGMSAPEIVMECTRLKNETFGTADDFADMKLYFNKLIGTLEADIENRIRRSPDPLRAAVSYALLGNYIDFGAMDSVDEEKLAELIDSALEMEFSRSELDALRSDLTRSRSLVYLSDNCGEIVFDKLLIKELLRQFPSLKITVLVRGENVLNDATLSDARQVGLSEIVTVLGNGTGIAGTCMSRLPDGIRKLISDADTVISKGQGNFETLCFSGMNIYYLFMCKCKMFRDKFKTPALSPMLVNDLRLPF